MKELIKKYLKKLTIANLRNYARKNNIYVSEPELIIIYNFIMKYQDDLLNKNDQVLEILKDKINNPLYLYLSDLYQKNKDKLDWLFWFVFFLMWCLEMWFCSITIPCLYFWNPESSENCKQQMVIDDWIDVRLFRVFTIQCE